MRRYAEKAERYLYELDCVAHAGHQPRGTPDIMLVWDTIQRDLPVLGASIAALLEQSRSEAA
jgi:hypothetical protein